MSNQHKMVSKREKEDILPNEVRVSTKAGLRPYVSYAKQLFDEGAEDIKITAIGNCIPKCIVVAEVLKKSIKGLHQVAKIGITQIVTTFEPLEEGLEVVEKPRTIPSLEISLSSKEPAVKDGQYSAPLADDQIVTDEEELQALINEAGESFRSQWNRGKGKGRGKKSKKDSSDKNGEEETEKPKGKGKRKSRKGRGKKGSPAEEQAEEAVEA